MSAPRAPTFDLAEMQALVRNRQWRATWEATAQAVALGLDDTDIEACVLALDEINFYKTMESTARPGTWQDVYKLNYLGRRIYLKLALQVLPSQRTVVIQFKKDKSL